MHARGAEDGRHDLQRLRAVPVSGRPPVPAGFIFQERRAEVLIPTAAPLLAFKARCGTGRVLSLAGGAGFEPASELPELP